MAAPATQIPVSPGVFTWPADEPRLLGSRCRSCGNHMFPTQSGCPRCTANDTEVVELGRRGTLWTWTVQGFPPKPGFQGDPTGKHFQPFGVGLVQLGDVVRVEARLSESDPERLAFGQEVELRIVPFFTDEDGDEIMTFEFAPVGA